MGDSAIEAVVALSDLGRYVSVDVASMNTLVSEAGDDDEDDGKGMRLYQSIYETALRNNIPKPVIEALIRIYSYDVDFQHKAQPGDSFDVLYAADEDDGQQRYQERRVVRRAAPPAASQRKYYRFQTTDDGIVDYYDETGKSAKKFLVRKPVATGIMRSGFGSRNHPLLGYTRCTPAWTGPRRSAPRSMPPATAPSRRSAGRSGYGKYVRIRHSNGYETAYGHMTAFARSTQPGARVRQGQVIGYVGSTGLSTGPHVHYEILVNGRFVDPLRVKLPRGRVLDGPMLASFEQGARPRRRHPRALGPRVAQGAAAARSRAELNFAVIAYLRSVMARMRQCVDAGDATIRCRSGSSRLPGADHGHGAVVEQPAEDRLVDSTDSTLSMFISAVLRMMKPRLEITRRSVTANSVIQRMNQA